MCILRSVWLVVLIELMLSCILLHPVKLMLRAIQPMIRHSIKMSRMVYYIVLFVRCRMFLLAAFG